MREKTNNNRYNEGDDKKFREGYRAAVKIPWSEARKTRKCQYTESGMCDSPSCVFSSDGCIPKAQYRPKVTARTDYRYLKKLPADRAISYTRDRGDGTFEEIKVR